MLAQQKSLGGTATTAPRAVFLDTNIFKFGKFRHSYYVEEKGWSGRWGDQPPQLESYFVPKIGNELDRIRSVVQLKEAKILPKIAFAESAGLLQLFSHQETKFERMSLPKMHVEPADFFGSKVQALKDLEDLGIRMILGRGLNQRQQAQDFFSRITNARYQRICRSLGGFQGSDRPLNLNQARDAFFLWVSEHFKMDYLLTMDRKFQRMVASSKLESSVQIVFPSELFSSAVKQLTWFRRPAFRLLANEFAMRHWQFSSE